MTTPPKVTTFPRFPSLPKELQVLIWRMALQEPRLVSIRRKDDKGFGVPLPADMADTRYYSPCDPPPPLTTVCTDSRALALKTYTRAFNNGIKPRYVYVNFEIDTVALENYNLCAASDEDRSAIRSLVLIFFNFFEHYEYFLQRYPAVTTMEDLRELTVVGQGWKTGGKDASFYEEVIEKSFMSPLGRPEGWVPPKKTPKITFLGEKEAKSIGIMVDKH